MIRWPLGAARPARSEHVHVDSTTSPSLVEEQSGFPVVHLSYECIQQERSREAATTLYEIACSITYPTESAHLSMRVTGQHTPRNAPAREIPITRHEAGATTYVELLEREQLEVRIVEQGAPTRKLSTMRTDKRSPNSTCKESPPHSNGLMRQDMADDHTGLGRTCGGRGHVRDTGAATERMCNKRGGFSL